MKKAFKLPTYACVLLMSIGLLSCGKDDADDPVGSEDCAIVGCTEELVTITINVRDPDGNPIALDDFKVMDIVTGADVTVMLSPAAFLMAQQIGSYRLAQDGDLSISTTKSLRFQGFLEGKEVINEDYIVQMDCCHISLTSGDHNLTIG